MNQFGGCPGSRMMNFRQQPDIEAPRAVGQITSRLRQWPVQLHLVSPLAPYYQNADVLLTADCVAYAPRGIEEQANQVPHQSDWKIRGGGPAWRLWSDRKEDNR